MPQLRDGSTVRDARLAALPYFDPRSLGYAVMDLFTKDEEPKTKVWNCKLHLDQGKEGACTGFAVAHDIAAQPSVVRKGITNKFAKEEIYWEAQKIDMFPGGAYPGADPHMDGSSVLAAVKVAKRLGYIKKYRWAFSVKDLVLAVGYQGPAILGIPWYEGMYSPAACGMIHPTGQQSGRHAILCRGVDVEAQTFLLHNSWGKDWGDEGTALVHWDDMKFLLKNFGEACIPTERAKP